MSFLNNVKDIHKRIEVEANLGRAFVKCQKCGKEVWTNGAICLRSGWPECCGETMELLQPESIDK